MRKWVEQGGNLLWLIDNDSIRGLGGLAQDLGLRVSGGVVIDPQAGGLQLPATFSLATRYGQHRITDRASVTSVFPYAQQLAAVEGTRWSFTPLVEVAPNGWLEKSGVAKNADFDPGSGDMKGPVVIAAALERDHKDSRQRVVVVGSGHFLASQYVGTLGNLDIGINMANWLAGDESLITVQPRPREDLSLELSRGALGWIGLGFLILLPIGFLAAGATIWWRRRKA